MAGKGTEIGIVAFISFINVSIMIDQVSFKLFESCRSNVELTIGVNTVLGAFKTTLSPTKDIIDVICIFVVNALYHIGRLILANSNSSSPNIAHDINLNFTGPLIGSGTGGAERIWPV